MNNFHKSHCRDLYFNERIFNKGKIVKLLFKHNKALFKLSWLSPLFHARTINVKQLELCVIKGSSTLCQDFEISMSWPSVTEVNFPQSQVSLCSSLKDKRKSKSPQHIGFNEIKIKLTTSNGKIVRNGRAKA